MVFNTCTYFIHNILHDWFATDVYKRQAYYRSVYNDLLSVDNTADGAAQAADIFKRRYEVASDPKDRTQKARDFFAKYYVCLLYTSRCV